MEWSLVWRCAFRRQMNRNFYELTFIDGLLMVKCDFTGHEMPARMDTVQCYLNGKKYRKCLATAMCNYDRQHLVPSKKTKRQQLFCKLTLRHLNDNPAHIERHIKGKRFQKALARWKECQRTGTKFIPRGGQKAKETDTSKQEKEGWESPDSGSELEDDDLMDLYPAEDFEDSDNEASENEDGLVDKADEFSFEEMEIENEDDEEKSSGGKQKVQDSTSNAVVSDTKSVKRSKSSNKNTKKVKRT